MSDLIDNELKNHKDNVTSIKDGRIIASVNDRFVGHLIDILCIFPLFVGYIILMEHYFGKIQEGEFFRQPIAICAYILLLFLLELFTSKTPGKIARKTIVVDYNGNKPSVLSVLIRNISRMIPFDSFSFLGDNRGWHDTISKTYVVYSNQKS